MNAQTTEGLTMEHQIDQLLDRLKGTVREPSFSYRLEEIRAIVIQLAECWTRYQRGEPAVPVGVLRGAGATSPMTWASLEESSWGCEPSVHHHSSGGSPPASRIPETE